jgi:hypothetical protein
MLIIRKFGLAAIGASDWRLTLAGAALIKPAPLALD